MPQGNLRHSAYGWFHNMMPLMYLYCQVALYAKINFWWIESLLCIIPIIIWSLSIVDESNKFTNDVFLSIYNTNMHIYNCTSTFFQVFATLSTSNFSFISTCIRTYTTSFLRLELYIMHLCTHTHNMHIYHAKEMIVIAIGSVDFLRCGGDSGLYHAQMVLIGI